MIVPLVLTTPTLEPGFCLPVTLAWLFEFTEPCGDSAPLVALRNPVGLSVGGIELTLPGGGAFCFNSSDGFFLFIGKSRSFGVPVWVVSCE